MTPSALLFLVARSSSDKGYTLTSWIPSDDSFIYLEASLSRLALMMT
jgi:hypothetical protein